VFDYWSQRAELNRRPTDYESVALPLSYAGIFLWEFKKGTLPVFCLKNQLQFWCMGLDITE
jgi:hypothetical protein